MLRRLALLVLLVALPGCKNNSESDAVAKAEAYLHAAAGSAPDRGWSLLHPADRERVYGDRDAYLARAQESEWDGFTWEYVYSRCDDGWCAVWLDVPGREAIPDVLASGPVIYRGDPTRDGANAVVYVTQRGPFDDGVSVPVH